MAANRSVDFFEAQFRREAVQREPALNPFERAVLPHLSGSVLDIGCGMGNLALAAAARGCEVTAVDACSAGIESLAARVREEHADVHPLLVDAREFDPARSYDALVSIGLLMFFDCPTAHALVRKWQGWVRPAGVMAVNVLVEGTTFLDMFDPAGHCLWKPEELRDAFAQWQLLQVSDEDFPAPGGTVKRFRTLIARKRAGPGDGIMAA